MGFSLILRCDLGSDYSCYDALKPHYPQSLGATRQMSRTAREAALRWLYIDVRFDPKCVAKLDAERQARNIQIQFKGGLMDSCDARRACVPRRRAQPKAWPTDIKQWPGFMSKAANAEYGNESEFRIRPPDINASTPALAADNSAFELRNFSLSRVAPHFDRRGMAAGIVQARLDQPLNPSSRMLPSACDETRSRVGSSRAEIHSACLRSRESVATIAPDASGQAAAGETSYGAASFLCTISSLASCGSRWGPMTC